MGSTGVAGGGAGGRGPVRGKRRFTVGDGEEERVESDEAKLDESTLPPGMDVTCPFFVLALSSLDYASPS